MPEESEKDGWAQGGAKHARIGRQPKGLQDAQGATAPPQGGGERFNRPLVRRQDGRLSMSAWHRSSVWFMGARVYPPGSQPSGSLPTLAADNANPASAPWGACRRQRAPRRASLSRPNWFAQAAENASLPSFRAFGCICLHSPFHDLPDLVQTATRHEPALAMCIPLLALLEDRTLE